MTDDFDRVYKSFQRLATPLEAHLTAQERILAQRENSSPTLEDLRAELALHEEALRIAAERRDVLMARREHASGPNVRSEREHLDTLLAEIEREVPLLNEAIRAIRNRIVAVQSAPSDE